MDSVGLLVSDVPELLEDDGTACSGLLTCSSSIESLLLGDGDLSLAVVSASDTITGSGPTSDLPLAETFIQYHLTHGANSYRYLRLAGTASEMERFSDIVSSVCSGS